MAREKGIIDLNQIRMANKRLEQVMKGEKRKWDTEVVGN